MKDVSQELIDLKREVVEARNQAIRTDNQLKNVALDVKGFDRRFEALEKRAKVSGVAAQALTALAVAVAAYVAYAARVGSLEGQVTKAHQDVAAAKAEAENQAQELRAQLSKLEQAADRRAKAEAQSSELLAQLDKRRDKEAAALLEGLNLDDLAPIGRDSVKEPVQELRRRISETSYRNARTLIAAGRQDAAVDELRRAIAGDPEGRYAVSAGYLLATQLWDMKRYDEVVPVVRKLQGAAQGDKALAEELRYLLITSLAHLGKKEEAQGLIADALKGNGRYTNILKAVQTALEQGSDLPAAASGRGSTKAPRRSESSTAPAAAKPSSPKPAAAAPATP